MSKIAGFVYLFSVLMLACLLSASFLYGAHGIQVFSGMCIVFGGCSYAAYLE